MQVEIRIDESATDTKVIVIANKLSDEINEIVRKISESEPKMLAGFLDDTVTVLDPGDVFRIYASGGKVFARTKDKEYTLRPRLYELEETLSGNRFVRVSNSEIVNLKKVKNFDLSLAGTICVAFTNGDTAYVSRRYVSKIKNILGI